MMSLRCLLFVLARPKKILVIVLLCPLKFFRRASHAGISMGRSSTVLNALPWLETSKSMPSTRTRFHQDAKWRRMKTNYPKESYMVILSTTYNQEALETLSQSSCFVFPSNFPDFPFPSIQCEIDTIYERCNTISADCTAFSEFKSWLSGFQAHNHISK